MRLSPADHSSPNRYRQLPLGPYRRARQDVTARQW